VKQSAGYSEDPRITKLIRNLSIVLSQHVVPIFLRHRGKPMLTGAGTLVSSKTNHYLVTAAHVLDPAASGEELFCYVEKGMSQRIAGEVMVSEPSKGCGRKDDRIDIGVVKLSGPRFPPFSGVEKFAISRDCLLPQAVPRDQKQYLLVGFPSSKSQVNPLKKRVNLTPFSFRNMGPPIGTYTALGLDPRAHILLGYSQRRTFANDGRQQMSPSPKGMSGSPLWLLYDYVRPRPALDCPIVGVVIENWVKEEVIVATDIGYAVRMIDLFEQEHQARPNNC